jgi:predicted metallopeptidase
MAFFDFLGHFFENLFNATAKAYNSLHEKEQEALVKASSIIAVVNENINAAPEFVFELLQQKFPELTKEELLSKLNELNTTIHKVDSVLADTAEGALTNLQEYLKQYEGKQWVVIVQGVVGLLANILNPEIGAIQKVLLCVEYVYQHFVKKATV